MDSERRREIGWLGWVLIPVGLAAITCVEPPPDPPPEVERGDAAAAAEIRATLDRVGVAH